MPRRFLHILLVIILASIAGAGCYAPLRTPAIPAGELPESFRAPEREVLVYRNMATLSAPQMREIIAAGDHLEIVIPGLYPESEFRPIRVQVTDSGYVHLPDIQPVHVAGNTLHQAHEGVNQAYIDASILLSSSASIALVQRSTVSVMVLGEVAVPGSFDLPRGNNDIAHALAMAGGMTVDAAAFIEVHRNPHRPFVGDFGSFPSSQVGVDRSAHGASRSGDDREPPTRMNVSWVHYQSPVDDSAWADSRLTPSDLPRIGWSAPHAAPPFADPRTTVHARPTVDARPTVQAQSTVGAMPPAIPVQFDRGTNVSDFPVSNRAHADLPHTFAPPYASDWQIEGVPPVQRIDLRGHCLNSVTPSQVVLEEGDVLVVPRQPQEVFYVVGQLNRNNGNRFSLDDRDREIGNGFLLPRDRDIDVVTAVAMAGYIDPIDSPTTVSVHRVMPDGNPMMVKVDLIKARYDRTENLMIQPGDIVYLNPDSAWWVRRTIDGVIARIIGSSFDKLLR